jgi:acetyl esterase/lipase
MRYFYLLLVFFLAGCSPLAYINLQISRKMEVARDISYAPLVSEPGTMNYQRKLDVYTRPDVPSKGTVIFVHGGYWDTGSKDEYPFLADSLTDQGFTTVTVDYTLVPAVTFPKYVEDVALAVKWTTENITEYGGNAENIFLMGHSAGAHIAALVAFDERYLQNVGLSNQDLSGFIGFAGPYDFLPVAPDDVRSVAALGAIETYPDTQPINFVDSTDPPAFLAVSPSDTTVNPKNTFRFAEKIRDVDGSVEEHSYDGVDHITILGAMGRASRFLNRAVLEDVLEFLQR